MSRVRRCDARCHNAKKPRCRCWCGGFFHGSSGSANRQALINAEMDFLVAHGFKQGETAYIEQKPLPEPTDVQ